MNILKWVECLFTQHVWIEDYFEIEGFSECIWARHCSKCGRKISNTSGYFSGIGNAPTFW